MKPIHIVFFLAFSVACLGTVDLGSSPEGADMQPDQAQNADTGTGDPDVAADLTETCADQACGANATCSSQRGLCECDAGFEGNPLTGCAVSDACATVTCPNDATCLAGECRCDAGFADDGAGGCAPLDACASTPCPYGATCNGGTCLCDAGFLDDGAGGCTQVAAGDTTTRTQAEVCTRWNTDQAKESQGMWQVEPIDACDSGVLHPLVITDALRRTSLFRWLVGLPGVTSMPQHNATTQACATTLAASNRGLSHSLDSSYTCFTPEAAQGAGSSNLAQGVSHPADSVNLYVGDNGVRSLGHRRWVLNPGMGATGFGQRGSYSCMYAFDRSGPAQPEYVAYPAPGYFPRNALIGYWSIGSSTLGLSAQTTVTMTRTDTGAAVPVEDVYFPGGGYGTPAVAWRVPTVLTDVEYEVVVVGAQTRTYRTTLVACN